MAKSLLIMPLAELREMHRAFQRIATGKTFGAEMAEMPDWETLHQLWRSDGRYYLAGSPPEEGDDPAVAYDDFAADHGLWENKVWPVLASRVPQFERIKLINSWVGHYAFNTLDQNAIIGPHSRVSNFLFSNGFSGHGFQQSPALGRGLSEWLIYGEYRNLDLSPFGFDRIEAGRPFLEKAVI